jgi:hypothetical protein
VTDQEALKIRSGDLLTTRICGKWATVEVVNVAMYEGRVEWVGVVRQGRKRFSPLGDVIRPMQRFPIDVGWASENHCRKDPESANVFADWLDEQGHAAAAAALRTAFPLAKPEEVPGW